jgi:hypothetical protein
LGVVGVLHMRVPGACTCVCQVHAHAACPACARCRRWPAAGAADAVVPLLGWRSGWRRCRCSHGHGALLLEPAAECCLQCWDLLSCCAITDDCLRPGAARRFFVPLFDAAHHFRRGPQGTPPQYNPLNAPPPFHTLPMHPPRPQQPITPTPTTEIICPNIVGTVLTGTSVALVIVMLLPCPATVSDFVLSVVGGAGGSCAVGAMRVCGWGAS